ncbi:hypothetical protein [Natronospira bacteriovora]|uniref:Lipoprotein n=1 Tax=Natronospira bacteriovora TaxID=3069753 RepID=A0ABU0W3M2_9GAMM|nr:hypothetical protein [Natronospira sp. AB-CW4]MDQ2068383.1 hypothetical protein [Natronospira sp. AB-CW4]
MNRLLAVMLLTMMFAACETGVSWDRQERENASHIFKSLDYAHEAARRANRLPHDWEPGGDDVAPVINALDDAIIHASQVRQSVLQKAHPNLNARFRVDYLRSLQGLRDYYETGDYDSDRHPGNTLGDFSEWFYQNQHEFRWWRGYERDLDLQ